jgi:hypothetical protein
LHSGVFEFKFILNTLVKLLKLLLVSVSFLIVGESLIINNLITYVGVTVVLAEWDSHGRHLVLSHLI